jgi:hypothetical protein
MNPKQDHAGLFERNPALNGNLPEVLIQRQHDGRSRYYLPQVLKGRLAPLPLVGCHLDFERFHPSCRILRYFTRQHENSLRITPLQSTMQHHLAHRLIKTRRGLIGFDFNQMGDIGLAVSEKKVDLGCPVSVESQRFQMRVERVDDRSVVTPGYDAGC